MFAINQYELLDFGGGRKLERFGPRVLDRPSPAAEDFASRRPAWWRSADARYERIDAERGEWIVHREWPPRWTVEHGAFQLELKPTEFGHLGVFPEQAPNWDWIAAQVSKAGRPLKVLNLFAYTGGATLAAAAAGARVVHIDAANNVVGRARRNAGLSSLADAPIRWIAEDAAKFVARELRRGNRYDAVILDPPSYGHGPKGEIWKVETSLAPLLTMCGELTAASRAFLLVTCHSPGLGPVELAAMLADAVPTLDKQQIDAQPLTLAAADGRKLPSGAAARWAHDTNNARL
jgi:23S rRNA (cytosine1962-C5)-methyltransferase